MQQNSSTIINIDNKNVYRFINKSVFKTKTIIKNNLIDTKIIMVTSHII